MPGYMNSGGAQPSTSGGAGMGVSATVPAGAKPTMAAPPRAPGKGFSRGKPASGMRRPFGMVARTRPLERGASGVK